MYGASGALLVFIDCINKGHRGQPAPVLISAYFRSRGNMTGMFNFEQRCIIQLCRVQRRSTHWTAIWK